MTEYNEFEYEVDGEDGKYDFKISLVDNKINLKLKETGTNQKGRNYEGEFTLEELRQIHKVFQLTNTIFDAQEEFKKAIEKQKISLSENEAYVNIQFQMILGTDNSPFIIALPRNESARLLQLEQDSDMFKLEKDNFYNKLLVIKKNLDEIAEYTDELEDETDELKDLAKMAEEEMNLEPPIPEPEVEKPKKRIPNQYNVIKMNNYDENKKKPVVNPPQPLLEEKIKPPVVPVVPSVPVVPQQNMKKKFKNGINYNIIKNPNDIIFVTQYIQNQLQRKISYNLIYNGKEDGDRAEIFHKKCDKAAMTLTLIMDNFGNRFGGFTTRNWEGKSVQKVDKNAFIFSIDKNKVYPILPKYIAIGAYEKYGPIFLGCQIRVNNNFLTDGGSTFKKNTNYDTQQDYELTNGNETFGIQELEVYEVR